MNSLEIDDIGIALEENSNSNKNENNDFASRSNNSIHLDKGIILDGNDIYNLNSNTQKHNIPSSSNQAIEINEKNKVIKSTLSFSNGSKYEGETVNNKRHGIGILYIKDGSVLEGNWNNDLFNGSGTAQYDKGTYHGEFKNSLFHGKGKSYMKNGDIYDGGFEEGKKNGYGVYYYKDGKNYMGNWKDDQLHNEGVFVCSNKDRFQGRWHMGKKHGKGILIQADGVIKDQEW
eukprot:CAMPEP_0170521576 /NCGR_PEP_ID=MMETSP0209-20121228/6961_1 /TAXON_ID=665100 ORGANISM="Litonotus pictus, Strain P1" /NCGR_SAMPLE_ID=MMETSP0209 /ASSEMBLY_ACC=CAM_ASM_000301 /LENGTH=230 /DNA_ID=CAMNT_0010808541 /DNA_START=971 /DNA_END=1660 /DNA_ORIENTATION=+